MAKSKYFYKTKKLLFNGKNQQEEDQLFFCSPGISQKLAKKFGLKNSKDVEEAFKKYFEFMKAKGITKFLNSKNIKENVENVEIIYDPLARGTEGSTNIVDETINFRKNRCKEKGVIFHEFNHLFSIHSNNIEVKKPTMIHGIVELDENGDVANNNLNEGITEFLSEMTRSYVNKQPGIISLYYPVETACASSLYTIFGNALFDAYFNGKSFEWLAAEGGGINCELLYQLSDTFSELDFATEFSPTWTVDDLQTINEILIQILANKVQNDLIKNIDKFNDCKEIELSALKAFSTFAGTLLFGQRQASLRNLNRNDTLNYLTETFFEVVENVGKHAAENPHLINFVYDPDEQFAKLVDFDSAWEIFELSNDINYSLIDWQAKQIDVLDTDFDVEGFYSLEKANYIRSKKAKIERPQNMKDFDKYQEIYEKISGKENSLTQEQIDERINAILGLDREIELTLVEFEDENKNTNSNNEPTIYGNGPKNRHKNCQNFSKRVLNSEKNHIIM